METLIYLDTNIYIDYFKNRADYLRPLGEFAFQLLKRTFGCEFKIVISGVVIKELLHNNCENELAILVETLRACKKLIEVEANNEDFKEARNLSQERGISFNDALHAIVAKKANAECLVTRNIIHFQEVSDLIKISYPESV
jgi:predicted nucleic acid-binding protein